MRQSATDSDPSDFNSRLEVDSTIGEDSSMSLAVLELDDNSSDVDETGHIATEPAGPCCEKCAVPLKAELVTICRNCGWYASLGTFVEIDPNWETDDEATGERETAPQTSHVQVWVRLVPKWGWVIIASVLAVIIESVVARLVTPAGSWVRTMWSLAQLAIGMLAVAYCHVFNFIVQAAEDADVGMLDIVIKPIKLWLRTFRRLPARLWVVDSMASGVTAVVMSLVVIGGIPYERLWDWGITPPTKQELLGAVMDQVKKVGGKEQSLEDAIDDFAGKAGVDELGNPIEPTPPAPPRKKSDCVVIGYQLDRDGHLERLLLGTAHLGRLVFAGSVTPKFDSAKESGDLLANLKNIRTHQRILPVDTEALWVKPTFACRVTYVEQKPNGVLVDVEWETFLGAMRTKSK